jgi:hypothetical protein
LKKWRARRDSNARPSASEVERTTLAVCAFGGFLAAQQAAKRMLPKGYSVILLTGGIGEHLMVLFGRVSRERGGR